VGCNYLLSFIRDAQRDNKGSAGAPFLCILENWNIFIVAATQKLAGNFSQIGTFLSKKRLFNRTPGQSTTFQCLKMFNDRSPLGQGAWQNQMVRFLSSVPEFPSDRRSFKISRSKHVKAKPFMRSLGNNIICSLSNLCSDLFSTLVQHFENRDRLSWGTFVQL